MEMIHIAPHAPERLYLIYRRDSGGLSIARGKECEDHEIDVIREAVPADLKAYPLEGKGTQELLDAFLKDKWSELEDVPFFVSDPFVDASLEREWWGFPKGTDKEEIWQVFDQLYSKGIAGLMDSEEVPDDGGQTPCCGDCLSRNGFCSMKVGACPSGKLSLSQRLIALCKDFQA